ncbi:cytochrome P450 3A30-like [Stegastes partitus]|uniref:Cytochrome P450 3A n=1 Tax=Stegastes partitus TaxID=144197 RepID=A0A3B5BCB8_9TELE|nr:PREDICTED: cytochrome P450 3A30-like [Stegastes partitus]
MDYFFYFSIQTWTLLVAFVTLLYVYATWTYGTFKNLGIPGPKPVPLFGTMLAYKKGITTFDLDCFHKYGKTWGIFDGRQPVLCTTDPSMIKAVLIKECYSLFTNRRNFRLNGPLYDAVSIAEDDQWRRLRGILSPSFTSGRLKEMFDIMKRHTASLIGSMKKKIDKDEPVDLKESFGSFSMDVVTSTSFSVDIDSLNNPSDPFVTNIKKMLKFDLFNPLLILVGFFPFLGPVFEKMELSFFPKSVTDFFYASLQKIKLNRLTSKQASRVDFLQLMIDAQKNNGPSGDQDKSLNDHEILSQAMIFLFAGYETTSSTLSFLAYNLATNPHIMKKLQEEIDTTLPNKAPAQYQTLMQMEYLDCVVNESLRMYPIAPRVERVAKATVEIGGIVIPKGTVFMVPTWALHRDPDVWPEPEEFKPERFRNKESIDPCTHLPFGLGPRNCIGMRFALVMIKLAMVEILQKYTFTVCKETEIPLEMDTLGLVAPKRPIKLKLTPRS